jgi:hypothetical protein
MCHLQKEEKTHDEKMSTANAKIKQAGEFQTYLRLELLNRPRSRRPNLREESEEKGF